MNYRWNVPSSSSPSLSPSSSTAYPTPSPSPKLLYTHPSFATHPFPTPLHDTLNAYNYILSSLLPNYSANPPPSNSSPETSVTFARRTLYGTTPITKITQRPILIYGSFLGGTLATSLALTESFASKQLPTRIAGLISANGIYDWTDISTSIPPALSNHQVQESEAGLPWERGWDSQTLYALREKLFSNPASTFDSFASPALFFRTAGIAVPKTWSSAEAESSSPEPVLASSISTPPQPSTAPSSPQVAHDEAIFHPTSDPSLVTDADLDLAFESENAMGKGRYGGELELEVSRRAHLKYPPKDSGLKIPRSLFLYYTPPNTPAANGKEGEEKHGEEVTAKGQAEEMVKLMRRSVLVHEFKERVLWDEELDPHSAADERIAIAALSSASSLEEDRVVREWIEEVLDM
jgi:hypothetical protein